MAKDNVLGGLHADNVSVKYKVFGGAFFAVDGVSMTIPAGKTVGVVGESGSGKSTLARAVAGLVPLASGGIVDDASGDAFPRDRVQMIFQDAYSSLNPRMKVRNIVAEGVRAGDRRSHRSRAIAAALDRVALGKNVIDKYPGDLSGGQRQRVAIARAIAAKPQVVLADEITSALDVSVRGEVLNALIAVQEELDLSVLFISHDIALVSRVCDYLYVMYCGKVVESGPTAAVMTNPQHPYTKGLLSAVPSGGQSQTRQPEWEPFGDPADPTLPPTGCRFHPRCPIGPMVNTDRTLCYQREPELEAKDGSQLQTACHFA